MDDTFLILLGLAAVAIVAGAAYRKQRGKRVRAERAAYIQKYAFPAELRNRLQRNHDLTLEGSGRVLDGLRQYFLACLAAQRSPLSKEVGMPSRAVDAAWHEFIVLTKEYASFCEKAFGRYLHHTPKAMMATPSNEALANTLHQLKGQSLTPAGWAMVGTVPLLFAIDRELGFKDGHVYDDSAFHALESQRQSMIASAASSGGGDASYTGSWGGGSDSGGGGSDGGGGGSCGGGGGCGGS
jgi:hypothetical protein